MNEHDRFIQEILSHPDDDGRRLRYADWLEARGDPRGEYLRLECELANLPNDSPDRPAAAGRLRRLRPSVDPDWLRLLARSDVERCTEARPLARCPERWDRLGRTEDDAVRFCSTCRKHVHYCRSTDQVRHHARLGHCVALDPSVTRRHADLFLTEDDGLDEESLNWLGGVPEDYLPSEPEPAPRHWRTRRAPGGLFGAAARALRGVLNRIGLAGATGRWLARARPGQPVAVKVGEFAGLQGTIDRVDRAGQRVRVSLPLFGGRMTVDFDGDDVEPSC
jgi:uncharacterized protein (TIGR02996 family)